MNYKDLTLEDIEKAFKELSDREPKTRKVKIYGLGIGALELFDKAMKEQARKLGFTVPEKFSKKNLENPK
jgi:hypothetical protein